jgi:hypothetical protein
MNLEALLRAYRHVVFADFEYGQDENGREVPRCLVYYVLPERRMYRLWLYGVPVPAEAPFPTGPDTLFVAFAAKAEVRCFLALGWPLPQRVVDVHHLARRATNGWVKQPVRLDGKVHYGLLDFMRFFDLDSIDVAEKDEGRALALRDGPYPEADRTALMNYCQTDVVALVRLFVKRLLRYLDLKVDLVLGRFATASARVEGLPIDVPTLRTIEAHKGPFVNKLIIEVNGPDGPWVPAGSKPPPSVVQFAAERGIDPYTLRDVARHLYGLDRATALAMGETPRYPIRDGGRVYDERRLRRAVELASAPVPPAKWSFSHQRFERLVVSLGVSDWPRTKSGKLSTDKDTLKDFGKLHGRIEELRHVIKAVNQVKLGPLPVCADGVCRYDTGDLRAVTGRNQPKAKTCPLLRSRYERGVIQAPPGFALIEADYVAQEFGIAAFRSGNVGMQRAYECGDPHLYLAAQCGTVPPGATKETHPREREPYKTVNLGVQYGQTPAGAARQLGVSLAEAESLFAVHKQFFSGFWPWQEGYLLRAQVQHYIRTPLGWGMFIHKRTKPRTVLNFAMQATGAEMLRIALCLLTEKGFHVCATLHDAVIVQAPSRLAEAVAAGVQEQMAKASAVLLRGHALKVEVKVFHHPDRLLDEKGLPFWQKVQNFICEVRMKDSPLPV